MRSLATVVSGSLSLIAMIHGGSLHAQAQGSWGAPFNHRNLNGAPGEVEQPPVARTDWITLNDYAGRDLTNPLPLNEKFNALHACLIGSGPHRGEVLVVDGNLRKYSMADPANGQPLQRIRAKQPWAIVNPYWPAANPYRISPNRFYNRVLTLPVVAGVNLGELFCGGHAWMHDGRLFWAGGTERFPTLSPVSDFIGSTLVWIFDPITVAWTEMSQNRMFVKRWYPTVAYDGNFAGFGPGRALIIGGTDPGGAGVLDHYESYEVPFNTQPTPTVLVNARTGGVPNPRLYAGIPGFNPFAPLERQFTDYPRVHLMSSGQFFVSGFETSGALWTHNVTADPTYSMNHGLMPTSGNQDWTQDAFVGYATSINVPNTGGVFDRIMRIGGMRVNMINSPATEVMSNLVETCNALTPGSQWSTSGTPRMYWNRMHANVVTLPGGELFAVGGLSTVSGIPVPVPNFAPELLINNSFWTLAAPQAHLRHYHSCALLLPDGRVFVSGGEDLLPAFPRPVDYQIYNPPYITMGLPRPSNVVVTTLGGTPISQDAFSGLQHGGSFRVTWDHDLLEESVAIEKIVLVRPAALTHHADSGQRYIILPQFSTGTDPRVERFFTVPANRFQVPAGWYMLFLVTDQSAPSDLAYWVHVG